MKSLKDKTKTDTTIKPTNNKPNGPVSTEPNVNTKSGNGVVEDEIKGGLADDKSVKDIAKKHNVKVGDIRKQIEMGIDVEREHTDSDKIAREIAMDHEDEFPYYYDALDDMEKDLEKGEELEEATAGGSAGAYEGLFSTQPVRQELHKTNVPVVDAGGMTKPIGKVRSFRRRNESKIYTKSQLKETNVFSKGEILKEALDGDAALGQYDTSAWGKSDFMLTNPKKGKKGKVRVKKTKKSGKDFRNTYDFDGDNNPGSKFVRIKQSCNKMNTPNCEEGAGSVEYSDKPFANESTEDKKSMKETITQSWKRFVEVAKREGKESVEAAKILKKVLTKEETTDNEIQFLKEQSGDIAKMLGVVAMGVVSTALPILVEKALNKKGVSILPKERSSLLDNDKEELIESICKKTGKSKNYVHSLINRYL
jgi:hypothetical protein